MIGTVINLRVTSSSIPLGTQSQEMTNGHSRGISQDTQRLHEHRGTSGQTFKIFGSTVEKCN